MSETNRRCAEEYTVKRGDSFYLIAHKLGVPLRDLLAANSDIHPARLMVGDVLCIPREEDDSPGSGGLGGTQTPAPEPAPDPAPVCAAGEAYTVSGSETAADLQLQNLLSRHTLEAANPDVNLDVLTPGQTLCIPTENIPCPLPQTYTLAENDTLESVAMRFNLPVASLLRNNPCLAPQDFECGVTVVLPR